MDRSAPTHQRTPVVGDDHGVAVAPEGLVEPVGVVYEVGDGVAAVSRDGGGGEAPHEGGHRPEPGPGQGGHEMAVGVGRVREAVQAQCKWARAALEVGEIEAICGDASFLQVHPSSLARLSGGHRARIGW